MNRQNFIKTVGVGTMSLPLFKIGQQQSQDSLKKLKPTALRPGDTIGIVAPAGIVYNEEDFDRMQEVMESFGLKVRFGEFVRERFGYFAGNDLRRALDVNRFFADPDIDAILAARGGWGCSRILPHLDFDVIRENPKIYCGFSDNTTLHLAFLNHCGLVSFHGPNGTSDWTDFTKRSFRELLIEGEKSVFRSKSNVQRITPGSAEGPLIGGNLTILTTSLATDYQPCMRGAILFAEDVEESVYRVDRMLTHLKLAGVLDQISGFIFGKCLNCDFNGRQGFDLEEVIRHHIQPLGIPAVMGADISHGPDNFTVPLGIKARLYADEGVFEMLENAVSFSENATR